MTNRSADATIKGYYYQFNKALFDIYSYEEVNSEITIEGIEDHDLCHAQGFTDAVQCKYYKDYSKTVIREALEYMFLHYKNDQRKSYNYKIYCHFDVFPDDLKDFDLTKLKSYLTKNRGRQNESKFYSDKDVSEGILTGFLDCLTIEQGLSFDELETQLIEKIKNVYNCDAETAKFYYYQISVWKIFKLSTKRNENERKITKQQLISQVDSQREILYNSIIIEKFGRDKYIRFLQTKIADTSALSCTKIKHLIFDDKRINFKNQALPFIPFLEKILKKTFKKSDSKPFLVVINDNNKLLEIKKELIREGLYFNDGYEEIEFSVEVLNKDPFIYKTHGSATNIRDASYRVKLISLQTYKDNIDEIDEPHVIFYISDNCCEEQFCNNYRQQIFQISVNNLLELSEILGV